MCTPTDRALAIEELEHLEAKVREWKDYLLDSRLNDPVAVKIALDMEKELRK